MTKIVCRIRRIKSMATIGVADRHNRRTHFTKSADPDRRHLNQVPIGGASLVGDIKAKLATVDGPLRSNGVLAIEMILTAAATWFEADLSRALAFLARALQQLIERYGDRLVRVDWHMDETAPHIHAFIVPLEVKADGKVKLNAKGLLGGPRQMHELQDWAGEVGKPLGLERGKGRVAILPENSDESSARPRHRYKSPRQYLAEAEAALMEAELSRQAARRMEIAAGERLAEAEREWQAAEMERATLLLQRNEIDDLMARLRRLNEAMTTLDLRVGEDLGATFSFTDASPDDVERVHAEVIDFLGYEPGRDASPSGNCGPW